MVYDWIALVHLRRDRLANRYVCVVRLPCTGHRSLWRGRQGGRMHGFWAVEKGLTTVESQAEQTEIQI